MTSLCEHNRLSFTSGTIPKQDLTRAPLVDFPWNTHDKFITCLDCWRRWSMQEGLLTMTGNLMIQENFSDSVTRSRMETVDWKRMAEDRLTHIHSLNDRLREIRNELQQKHPDAWGTIRPWISCEDHG